MENNFKTEYFSFQSTNQKNNISAVIYIPNGKPKGILQISHGMCEYIGRYADFMSYVANCGYIAVGHDHLGHGDSFEKSEYGYFGKKNGYIYLVEDLHRLTQLVKERFPSLPYFLLGHSMGSFIARLYIKKYAYELNGAVICGTAGANPAAGLGIFAALAVCKFKGAMYRSPMLDKLAFGSYNKKYTPARTDKDWLSRDNSIVDKYLKDEKCMFLFTAAGFVDLLKMLKNVNKASWFKSVDKNLPIFIISGDADPVGNYGRGVGKVYEKLKKAGVLNVSLRLYEGARHELLNETNRKEVYEDILRKLSEFLKISE